MKNKFLYLILLCSMIFIVIPKNTVVEAKNVSPTEYIDGQKLPSKVSVVNGIPIVNKQNPVPKNYGGYDKLKGEADKQLTSLIAGAKKSKYSLESFSGYRTIEYQKNLYDKYVKANGKEKADQFSARPNYSEHHLGLAFDIKDSTIKTSEFGEEAEKSESIKWLHDNMYKYGFILRYTEGNEKKTGYIAEFWHIRYVGKEHAKAMKDAKINVLEEYLGMSSGEVIKGDVTKSEAPSNKTAKALSGDKKEEAEKTESSKEESKGQDKQSGYKKFDPFIKNKVSKNSVVGVDTKQTALPSELSYNVSVYAENIRVLCAYIISIFTLFLIVVVSVQIASISLMNTGREIPSKLESFLFGKNTSSNKFINIIIQNSIILVCMIGLTVSLFYEVIQRGIYSGILVILSYIF